MDKKTIRLFGGEPPCARCRALEKGLKEAIKELALDVHLVNLSALSEEADKYDILSTPAVVINEKVVLKGIVPSKTELKKLLANEFRQGEE